MKIAVTYENGAIFQHFGHTQQFKLYDVADGRVTGSGIGGGAKAALAEAGIALYGGVSGSADGAVEALLKGGLAFDPDIRCAHHEHEHGEGEGHVCGSGCGGRCGK